MLHSLSAEPEVSWSTRLSHLSQVVLIQLQLRWRPRDVGSPRWGDVPAGERSQLGVGHLAFTGGDSPRQLQRVSSKRGLRDSQREGSAYLGPQKAENAGACSLIPPLYKSHPPLSDQTIQLSGCQGHSPSLTPSASSTLRHCSHSRDEGQRGYGRKKKKKEKVLSRKCSLDQGPAPGGFFEG